MSKIISVKNVTKTFKVTKKEPGLMNSVYSLFHKKYEEKVAVDNISFTISEGDFVGFIGPNGAGKTTTIKMLSGIIHPDQGDIKVLGYIPQKLQNEFKRQFAITMGQKNQLWWDIPAFDSFNLLKEIYRISDKDFKLIVTELSELLRVQHLLKVPIRNLSLGERMKMEFIGSLLHNPKVLFLDEPTIGLDVSSRRKIREFLYYINCERKITIILTSHYLEDINKLCNKVIAINKGKIIYDGAIEGISEKSFMYKMISISFSNKNMIKLLKSYGRIIESTENRAKLLVNKKDLKEFGKTIFPNDEFFDLNIQDIPIDDIFESLFTEGGLS